MPRATLVDDHRRMRHFHVDLCPIHILYDGNLFARQAGCNWNADATYRLTSVLRVTGADSCDPPPDIPQ